MGKEKRDCTVSGGCCDYNNMMPDKGWKMLGRGRCHGAFGYSLRNPTVRSTGKREREGGGRNARTAIMEWCKVSELH